MKKKTVRINKTKFFEWIFQNADDLWNMVDNLYDSGYVSVFNYIHDSEYIPLSTIDNVKDIDSNDIKDNNLINIHKYHFIINNRVEEDSYGYDRFREKRKEISIRWNQNKISFAESEELPTRKENLPYNGRRCSYAEM